MGGRGGLEILAFLYPPTGAKSDDYGKKYDTLAK